MSAAGKTPPPDPVYPRRITLWCESKLADDSAIAAALEEGRLWEVCVNVQYLIEAARG